MHAFEELPKLDVNLYLVALKGNVRDSKARLPTEKELERDVQTCFWDYHCFAGGTYWGLHDG